MAIVQQNSGNTGSAAPSSVDATLGAATTAGSGRYVIIIVSSDATVNTPSGFSVDRSQVNNAGHYVFRKSAANSETTWTITPTSAAATCWWVAEISGLDASSPLDQVQSQGTGSSGTTQSTGTTGTTTQATELAIASFSSSVANQTTVTGSGYTNSFVEQADTFTNRAGAATDVGLAVATKDLSATGTQECTVTWSVAVDRTGIMVTYKATAGTTHDADGTVTATASRTAAGQLEAAATGTLTATASRTAAAALDLPATATLTATASRTSAAAVDRPATAALTATAGLTATGTLDAAATAALATTATITAAADVGVPPVEAQAALTVTAGRSAGAAVDRPATASAETTAGLLAGGAVDRAALATVSTTASVTAAAALTLAASATRTATATIAATAEVAGSIIFRPNTGTITRPNTGIILRP